MKKENLKAFAWILGAVVVGSVIYNVGAHFIMPMFKGESHVGLTAGAGGKKASAKVTAGAEPAKEAE